MFQVDFDAEFSAYGQKIFLSANWVGFELRRDWSGRGHCLFRRIVGVGVVGAAVVVVIVFLE